MIAVEEVPVLPEPLWSADHDAVVTWRIARGERPGRLLPDDPDERAAIRRELVDRYGWTESRAAHAVPKASIAGYKLAVVALLDQARAADGEWVTDSYVPSSRSVQRNRANTMRKNHTDFQAAVDMAGYLRVRLRVDGDRIEPWMNTHQRRFFGEPMPAPKSGPRKNQAIPEHVRALIDAAGGEWVEWPGVKRPKSKAQGINASPWWSAAYRASCVQGRLFIRRRADD